MGDELHTSGSIIKSLCHSGNRFFARHVFKWLTCTQCQQSLQTLTEEFDWSHLETSLSTGATDSKEQADSAGTSSPDPMLEVSTSSTKNPESAVAGHLSATQLSLAGILGS